MAFDKSELEQVAHLARLHINEAETDEVAARITDILALIDEMQSVSTDGVEPLAHPLDVVQRLRPDNISTDNQQELLHAIAPSSDEGFYLVPQVMEDTSN